MNKPFDDGTIGPANYPPLSDPVPRRDTVAVASQTPSAGYRLLYCKSCRLGTMRVWSENIRCACGARIEWEDMNL